MFRKAAQVFKIVVQKRIIYPGHGPPISNKDHSWIIDSLLQVKRGQALKEMKSDHRQK